MLENKNLLVTGASYGIGLATVKKYLKEGANVLGVGEASDEMKNLGDKFTFFECDVTDEAQIQAACKKAEELFDHLDGLVTICDKSYAGSVTEFDSAVYHKASDHIVLAPMLFTKYAIELLRKAKNPCILHDVPVSALMVEADFMMASLNTAVVNYVRQSVPQLRPVRINAVMYGLIKGHLLSPEKEAKYTDPKNAALLPAKRLGTPEDVANFNAFLMSDKARYINSAAMQVDGGLYTMNPRSMGSAI